MFCAWRLSKVDFDLGSAEKVLNFIANLCLHEKSLLHGAVFNPESLQL